MFSLTGGEIGLVLFLFGLTWGAGALPRTAEWLAERVVRRSGAGRGG